MLLLIIRRLLLKYDKLLSSLAFTFNLRRNSKGQFFNLYLASVRLAAQAVDWRHGRGLTLLRRPSHP